MKKILSLLSMLMITVMAFATDYTDQLTFKLTVGSNSSEKSLPQGTLTIEKRVDGTYNVTASGCDFSAADFGNWGDISCDGVAGTTNADGLTTIEVSKPEVFANGSVPSGYSLSGQSLLVKFNGTKAYALLKGKLALNAIVGYPFEYTFGTDKGFDGGSTGGGETGGETSSVVTVLENFKNDGNRFSHSFKIDWDKQKVVMSIDPTSCGNDLEHIVGLGVDCTQLDGALHVYNKYFDRYGTPAQTYNRQMLQAYFPMPGNNKNTGVFDRKSPFSIEVSKDNGFVVDGEVKISASQMTSLFAQANLTVGSGQGGNAASHALYKYIKVVPLDWTEVPPVVPEVVDVVEEGFKATGSSWKKEGIAIDWDTQYIAAKLDLSTCKVSARPENVLAVGTDITGWNDGPHYFFYYNKADKVLQYNYLHKANSSYNSGFANLSKAYIQLTDEVVTIEISKQGGLKINGESALVKYVNTASNPSNNSTESWTTEDLPTVFSGLWALNPIDFGGCQGDFMSNATYKYVKVVPLGWKEPVTPPSVKDTKTFNEALYMVQGTTSSKLADATVEVKEMSDKTINMSLKYMETEYTSTELTKGTDDKNRTTYTGKVSNGSQTYDVAGVVYEKDNAERLYMTMTAAGVTLVVGENPDAVTPDPGVTEESNKTYTSNLRILDGETTVVEEAEANVNIIKYSDESYKVTLKNVNMLNKTQDLVFVGKALIEEAPTEATEPLTIIAKSDAATTEFFGEEMSATFEITEVSAEEIKMGFVLNKTSLKYQGEFNYTEEETPEVYTNNLHIYDAAAPETDLFQADQAKVEFLATATGGFKLTLKDVTLNEKTQDLVFTGTLPTPQPGGQDPLAEEGETTPAEPAMVLNATADEATATFLGTTSATAVFNVIMNDEAETENDAFALTFTITAGEKNYAGEFNYEKKDPVEEYPVNFDKTAKSTHSSRALNSFSLQQTGKDKQTESVYASKAAYEDHTSKVFTVEAGSELTASFDYTGEWMHSFVYIDFDNDGQFSYKEGQWDQTGTDLVAFSFYSLDSNPKNDASGYNSVGDELTGDARNTYVAPSFKAPAKAGEYRIRFKFDWNCILPGGSSSILSDGGGVWDATLKVVEPVVDGISTINAEVANGETQLFTVNGVKLNKLQKGLNIVRTADGKVKKVLVK